MTPSATVITTPRTGALYFGIVDANFQGVRLLTLRIYVLLAQLFCASLLFSNPIITKQPQSVVDQIGKVSSVSVEARGEGQLRYQWHYYDPYFGSTSPVPGETNAVFTPKEAPFFVPVLVEIADENGTTRSESAKIDWVQRTATVELSRWPGPLMGPALGSAIQGDLAYVGAGALQVFDISDRRAPVRIGTAIDPDLEYGYETERIRNRTNVRVEGNIACAMYAALIIYDLSNPRAPKWLSDSWSIQGTVTLADRYAYICGGYQGIAIINLQNPREPRIASQFLGYSTNGISGWALMLALRDEYLYVAETDALASGETSSLRIFNVKDKARPSQVVRRPGTTYGVAIEGNKLYTVGDGLQIFDITEPINPKLRGKLGGSFNRMSVSSLVAANGFVYLCYGTNGLWRYDVRDPANPKAAGKLVNGGPAVDLQISGETGYLSNGDVGWQVIDLSAFPNPTVVENTDASGVINELVLTNNLVFAAAMSSGLEIVDVTEARTPKGVAQYKTPGEARSIAMRGDIVYLACGLGGLELVNMQNPSAPVHVSNRSFRSESVQLVLTTGTNLIVATDAALYVFDITNPALLASEARPFSLAPYVRLIVADDFLVADTWEFGLWNENIKTLNLASSVVRTFPLQFNGATWPVHEIMRVLQTPVAEIEDPIELWTLTFFGKSNNSIRGWMHLSHDLMVGFRDTGSTTYDVSTPLQPGVTDNGKGFPGAGSVRQVVVAGDRLYAASSGAGIQVLEWDSGTPRLISGLTNAPLTFMDIVGGSLKVTARGARPLTYKWYEGEKGDTNHPLALADAPNPLITESVEAIRTNANLSLRTWVRASNELGFTDSESVTVSVKPLLFISGAGPDAFLEWRSIGTGSWKIESSSNLLDWAVVNETLVENAGGRSRARVPITNETGSSVFFRIEYVGQ